MAKKKEPTKAPVKEDSKPTATVEPSKPAVAAKPAETKPAPASAPAPKVAEKPAAPAPTPAAPAPKVAEKPAAPAPVPVTPVSPAPVAKVPAKAAATPAKTTKPAASAAKASKPATSAKPGAPVTIIIAKYDVGIGKDLYIRGEGAGLSWDAGILMENVGSDVWVWTTNQIAEGLIAFKFLINDEIWSAGDNMSASVGETTTLTPYFP